MSGQLSPTKVSVILRFASLCLISIPIAIILGILLAITSVGIGTPTLIEIIMLTPFFYGTALLIGWIGIVIKSLLAPLFLLLQINWKYNTLPTGCCENTYSNAFYDHLHKNYRYHNKEKLKSNAIRHALRSLKILILAYTVAAMFLIIAGSLSLIDEVSLAIEIIIGPITWLNPISAISNELFDTRGGKFLFHSIVFPTSYVLAISLENLARYVELRLWREMKGTHNRRGKT